MRHATPGRNTTRTNPRLFIRLLFFLVLALCLGERRASASAGILVESTDSYSSCFDPTIYPSLHNNKAYVENFAFSMPGWTVLANWTGIGLAWDRDFVDSDFDSRGDDNAAFDLSSGLTISMYSGHGDCKDRTVQSCSTSSQCTNPAPYSQYLPGSCLKGPIVTSGTCIYGAFRDLVTCGSNDAFGHIIDTSDGEMALGESSNSGTWRHVGTNGGVNFSIIDVSCGVRPGHEAQGLWNAFAGVGNIATVMPTVMSSDTNDTPMRGAKFAARFQANPNSSIAYSWASMISDMSSTDGQSCNGDTSGFRGIDGCGANWVGSVAQDSTTAWWLNQTESWVDVQSDAHDATGAGWMTWTYYCNYDCNTYPITI